MPSPSRRPAAVPTAPIRSASPITSAKISRARHADGPERADERPPLHHRERRRLVDEEHADDEREERQRGQVPLKRANHLRGGARARAGGDQLRSRRQGAGDSVDEDAARIVIGSDQVDAAQAADGAEDLLGGGDVGDEEPVQRPRARRVGGLENADRR